MRYVVALPAALLITCAVFLFMETLIAGRNAAEVEMLPLTSTVLFEPPKKKPPKEPEQQQTESDASEEPSMDALDVGSPAPVASTQLELPALDVSMAEMNLPALGERWSAPMGAGGAGLLDGQGVDAQGFVEVIPYNTRRPNVPELAWKNKVSGWVLVAFNVTSDGNTRNIRVLDARPRGVFEEKVIAAVKDWQYSVRARRALPGDVVMTQKVEVDWRNYPQNTPNVD